MFRVCKYNLGITLTVSSKLHMVVSHIKPELERTKDSLCKDSEQTGEVGPAKMKKEMGRYKRAAGNPNHGDRMLAGCSRFLAKRIN